LSLTKTVVPITGGSNVHVLSSITQFLSEVDIGFWGKVITCKRRESGKPWIRKY